MQLKVDQEIARRMMEEERQKQKSTNFIVKGAQKIKKMFEKEEIDKSD